MCTLFLLLFEEAIDKPGDTRGYGGGDGWTLDCTGDKGRVYHENKNTLKGLSLQILVSQIEDGVL